MHRRPSPLALIVTCSVLGACYGAEEMGDAGASDLDVAAGDELACYIARGTFEETQDRPSPLRETELTVGGGQGLLCYGAPSALDRRVMDSLVPYGQPWRIGANEPTTLHLAVPANVGGVALEPGSYSLYAIPGVDEWEFLINTSWQRWGIPIDSTVRSADIGSFTATPEPTVERVETLRYSWEPMSEGTMGNLYLEWENTRVGFHVHPGS